MGAATPTILTQTFATPTVTSGPERLAISLELGARADIQPTSGTVTVTATVGSTIVGETTFNPVAAVPGEAYTVQFTTDDLAALGLAGQSVTLSITNDANNQVLVGDVNVAAVTAPPPPVTTLTFDVTSENGSSPSDMSGLNNVIRAINVGGADAAGNGVYQINITGPITLSSQITALHLAYGASLTIAGTTTGASAAQVVTIDGQHAYQGFFAYSGNITLQDLTIENTIAKGGNGSGSGGGGGGGSANVTLENVNFSGDAAKGGNGGGEFVPGTGGGGALDSGIFDLGPGQYGGGGRQLQVGGFGGGGGRGVRGTLGNYGQSREAGFGGGGGAGGNLYRGPSGFYTTGAAGSVFGGGRGYNSSGGGGGGLGAGGDIFVQQGGSLTIEGDALGGGSLGAGSVTGGAPGEPVAQSGSAFGSGMFLSGNQSFTLAPLSGQTLTVAGVIADMSGSGSSGLGQLIIDGAGTVALSAANTYQGGTVVKEGTLSIFTASNIGGGTLTLENGTTVDLTAGFNLYNSITVSGDPTFDVPTGQTNVIGSNIADGTSPGDVVLTGGGMLALTNGGNSYSGGTTIEGGSTLELGAVGAAGSGAISFSGTGDTLEIDGTTMPSNTIDMTPGNTIDLTGIAYDSAPGTAILVGSQLQVTENGTTYDLNLSGIPAGEFFHLASDHSTAFGGLGGTDITENTTPCYCRGTLIRTPHGKRPVEELKIGDLVVTVSGEPKPIKWIGRRSYDGRFIRGNKDVLPIDIAAGALRRGVPARDLWVSPGHAFWLEDVLVPARLLVNGLTITQAESVERVDYFHLEFEGHEIIVAEGAAAESYVESHNRRGFHNADEFYALYPDDDRPSFAECAPRVTPEMPVLGTIRQKLFDRAEVLGFPTTDDPDLHLVADGAVIRPSSVENDLYTFTLAEKPQELWLASRSAIPAELELMSTDTRRLGVCLDGIVLADAHLRLEVSHAHLGLSQGFHADEGPRRWTDGLARLPVDLLVPFPGAVTLTIHRLDAKLRYPRGTATELAPSAKSRTARA